MNEETGGDPQLSSFEQPHPETADIQDIHRSVLREQHEPSEGQQRVPVVLFLLFIGLAMWAGYYLSEYDGNFSANRFDGPEAFTTSDPSTMAAVKEKSIDPLLLGKRIYNRCVPCHQVSGEGVAGQYPPLNRSEWVLGDDRILARILVGGLSGPIEVLGKNYNAQMPAWPQLSDSEISAVLTYIRQSWDNQATAVAPETIAAVRSEATARAASYTADQLLSLNLAAEEENQSDDDGNGGDDSSTNKAAADDVL